MCFKIYPVLNICAVDKIWCSVTIYAMNPFSRNSRKTVPLFTLISKSKISLQIFNFYGT